MKVILINDENTKLTKADKRKVSILKLTENGRYLEGIGIKDNDFFLLVEDEADKEYLEFTCQSKQVSRLSKDSVVRVILAMMRGKEITAKKAKLLGKEPTEW